MPRTETVLSKFIKRNKCQIRKLGTGKWSNLPKVIQLIASRVEIQTPLAYLLLLIKAKMIGCGHCDGKAGMMRENSFPLQWNRGAGIWESRRDPRFSGPAWPAFPNLKRVKYESQVPRSPLRVGGEFQGPRPAVQHMQRNGDLFAWGFSRHFLLSISPGRI